MIEIALVVLFLIMIFVIYTLIRGGDDDEWFRFYKRI